jgi:UDP-N-acetylmuramyl pentapeptide synthase
MGARTRARVVTFGIEAGDVRGRLLPSTWPAGIAVEITAGAQTVVIRTGLAAEHFLLNVTAAVAAATALGEPLPEVGARLEGATTLLGRATLQHVAGGVTLVRADWKSPVWTLPRSLHILRRASGAGRRYLVLGTLSDYGGDARRVYRQAITTALEVADQVLLVGPRVSLAKAFATTHPGRVFACATVREAAEALSASVRPPDVVLLKGSNKADHLARIALHLGGRTVRCWQERCGRIKFCDDCAFAGKASQ